MNLLLFYPEQEVFKQGDTGTKIYFIARGECDVFINDEYGTSSYTKTLERSDYFGEVSILKGKLN
jgi:CRP-like cAMP-binding protein